MGETIGVLAAHPVAVFLFDPLDVAGLAALRDILLEFGSYMRNYNTSI
jgi:hypothetical protein